VKRVIAAFILTASLSFAQTQPSFEVASIKPSNSADTRKLFTIEPGGRFIARNTTVKFLIQEAYRIKDFQISGATGWVASELFDIVAKQDSSAKPEQFRAMLQSLLADRFQLVFHRDTSEMPVYALVVAKNGPKFKEANESDPNIVDLGKRPDLARGDGRPRFTIIRRGRLVAQSTDMAALADDLANFLGRTVVDRTGLAGSYDVKLEWVPDENQVAMFQAMGVPEGFGAPPADWQGPSLVTALEEQLGLKLDSQKGPVEMFTIKRVERPSEN
jgi:bla regulator protein blaR1